MSVYIHSRKKIARWKVLYQIKLFEVLSNNVLPLVTQSYYFHITWIPLWRFLSFYCHYYYCVFVPQADSTFKLYSPPRQTQNGKTFSHTRLVFTHRINGVHNFHLRALVELNPRKHICFIARKCIISNSKYANALEFLCPFFSFFSDCFKVVLKMKFIGLRFLNKLS